MAEQFVGIPWGREKVGTTTRREHPLGQLGLTPDGRMHRWGFSDGAIGAGNLLAQKAPTTTHDMGLAIQAAAAVGDQSIAVTLEAGAATLNQYEDGKIYINDGAGEGHIYHIKSNPVAAASATLRVVLQDGDVVREALTTATSKAGLIENTYKDFVVHPTTTVGAALGFANDEIADNEYNWICSRGEVAALVQGTLVLGETGSPSTTTAGSVTPTNYGGTVESPIVCKVSAVVAATTEYQYAIACID